jgi:hypothetical protein
MQLAPSRPVPDEPESLAENRPPRRLGRMEIAILASIALLLVIRPVILRTIAPLAVAYIAINVVHIAISYVLSRMMGIHVQRIDLFFGGAWLRWRYEQTWISVGWFLLGSSLTLKSGDSTSTDRDSFAHLSRFARAGFCLAGPLAQLFLALLLLGPKRFEFGLRRVPDQASGLLFNAPELVRGLIYFAEHASIREVIGAVAMVVSLWNLLPLPLANGGGRAILELLNSHVQSRRRIAAELASLLLWLFGSIAIVIHGLMQWIAE